MQLPYGLADGPNPHLLVSQHVLAALRDGGAVVALESTIISHGMPFPQNLETARAVEAEVRSQGAVPATIAILDGRCIVGLDDRELERLARLGRERVAKVSRRDLAAVVSSGGHGATTVSATMVLAHAAGIQVFVTGGIGGVHRGGQDSLDISADLVELARTPMVRASLGPPGRTLAPPLSAQGDAMLTHASRGCADAPPIPCQTWTPFCVCRTIQAVVCAGVKSILDIPRTLEVLETAGVTVATVSPDPHAQFPAFFTAASGHASPLIWRSETEAAAAIHAALGLQLGSGQLIAVPVPDEHAAEGAQIEAAIQRALSEAEARGVRGADTTPFLLHRVNELTGGSSLAANIALIKNNARVGARIAAELARRLREPAVEFRPIAAEASTRAVLCSLPRGASGGGAGLGLSGGQRGSSGPGAVHGGVHALAKRRPLVVGGTAADLTARPVPGGGELILKTSNFGALEVSPGGVARNIGEALARLGCRPLLLSLVGADALGDLVLKSSEDAGLDVSAVSRAQPPGRLGEQSGFGNEAGAATAQQHNCPGALAQAGAARGESDTGAGAYRTATYTALHQADGDLLAAVADMAICAAMDGVWVRAAVVPRLAGAPIVVADANLPTSGLSALAEACSAARVPLFLEPVSVPKAAAAARSGALAHCAFASPNEDELLAIAHALDPGAGVPALLAPAGTAERAAQLEHAARGVLARGTHTLLITCGAAGVLVASRDGAPPGGAVRFLRYPAHAARVQSTRGAGDSLVGGFVAAWLRGAPEAACVHAALAAAAASLESDAAISPALSPALLPPPHWPHGDAGAHAV